MMTFVHKVREIEERKMLSGIPVTKLVNSQFLKQNLHIHTEQNKQMTHRRGDEQKTKKKFRTK